MNILPFFALVLLSCTEKDQQERIGEVAAAVPKDRPDPVCHYSSTESERTLCLRITRDHGTVMAFKVFGLSKKIPPIYSRSVSNVVPEPITDDINLMVKNESIGKIAPITVQSEDAGAGDGGIGTKTTFDINDFSCGFNMVEAFVGNSSTGAFAFMIPCHVHNFQSNRESMFWEKNAGESYIAYPADCHYSLLESEKTLCDQIRDGNKRISFSVFDYTPQTPPDPASPYNLVQEEITSGITLMIKNESFGGLFPIPIQNESEETPDGGTMTKTFFDLSQVPCGYYETEFFVGGSSSGASHISILRDCGYSQ